MAATNAKLLILQCPLKTVKCKVAHAIVGDESSRVEGGNRGLGDLPCLAFDETEEGGGRKGLVHVKLLHFRNSGDITEVWFHVVGDRESMRRLESRLAQESDVAYQIVSKSKHDAVIRVVAGCHCSDCLLRRVFETEAALPYFVVVVKSGVLVGFVAVKLKHVNRLKQDFQCNIISEIPWDDCSDPLTFKQVCALVKAYMHGYYCYPRRISMKDLAAKMRVSSSSLAELIHRAEAKIIRRFLLENYPYYVYSLIESMRECH